MITDIEKLKYPIGKFKKAQVYTPESINELIAELEIFPYTLRDVIIKIPDRNLDEPYRFGGWTARQVVHHLADSHMNSFIRFKLALTEDKPIIRPYFEDRWAELDDSKTLGINCSIHIITGVHARWAGLLSSINFKDFRRSFIHPEHGREIFLDEALDLYVWHGKHHLGHINLVKG